MYTVFFEIVNAKLPVGYIQQCSLWKTFVFCYFIFIAAR